MVFSLYIITEFSPFVKCCFDLLVQKQEIRSKRQEIVLTYSAANAKPSPSNKSAVPVMERLQISIDR